MKPLPDPARGPLQPQRPRPTTLVPPSIDRLTRACAPRHFAAQAQRPQQVPTARTPWPNRSRSRTKTCRPTATHSAQVGGPERPQRLPGPASPALRRILPLSQSREGFPPSSRRLRHKTAAVRRLTRHCPARTRACLPESPAPTHRLLSRNGNGLCAAGSKTARIPPLPVWPVAGPLKPAPAQPPALFRRGPDQTRLTPACSINAAQGGSHNRAHAAARLTRAYACTVSGMKLPRPVSGDLIPHRKLTALPRSAGPEGGLSGPIPLLPPPERPAQNTQVGLCHKDLSLREAPLRKRGDWRRQGHMAPPGGPDRTLGTRAQGRATIAPPCRNAKANPHGMTSGAARVSLQDGPHSPSVTGCEGWQIRGHRVQVVRPDLTRGTQPEKRDMPALPDCTTEASPHILPSGSARVHPLRRSAGLRQSAQGLLTPGGRGRGSG